METDVVVGSGGLTESYLLLIILSWYGDLSNWSSVVSRPPAVLDAGRYARSVLKSPHLGNLLRVVCDIHNIPLTELSRKTTINIARMNEIIKNSTLTERESTLIKHTIELMIAESI
jgi:hypothetical protein